MKNIIILLLCLGTLFLVSCEDVIDVDVDFEEAQLVVDAWLDNLDREQTVRLTLSQDYFENQFAKGVTDATVTITRNDEEVLEFENRGNGDYVWTPNGGSIGNIGDSYLLTIEWKGDVYVGNSVLNRVPPIDSIVLEFIEDNFGIEDGIYAELFVTDLVGAGDTYWARTWKNDTLLNKPDELNIVYDATFGAGTNLDGVTWIPPLRSAINPTADSDRDDETFQIPYLPGDKIYCEVYSISNEAFRFLQIAEEQMTNEGLFAVPIANTNNNVSRVSDNKGVIGFFNVGAVSTMEVVVD